MPAPDDSRVEPPPPSSATRTVSAASAPTKPELPPVPAAPSTPAASRPAPARPQAFSLLLPGKSGAVFLQHGRSRVLPLFTSWDEAAAFLVNARMTRCWIIEFSTTDELADFLRAPPGRPITPADYLVSVDPTDLMHLATALFPARELIGAIVGGRF